MSSSALGMSRLGGPHRTQWASPIFAAITLRPGATRGRCDARGTGCVSGVARARDAAVTACLLFVRQLRVMLGIVGSSHTIAERFEILELAGAGGAASVYRAIDRHSRQPVAVKLLRTAAQADDIERFAREAALLSQLSHPGIVRYVTHGR